MSRKPKPLAVLLNQPFADWEVGFLTASVRDFFETDVSYYSSDGGEVRSEGGLRVLPAGVFSDVRPDNAGAVIVCGSGAWAKPDAADISSLLTGAVKAGTLVGVICAGTLTAARAGLFDTRGHTSNGLDWLKEHGGAYRGAALYQDANDAVHDRGVVSAPASAPAAFAAKIIERLYAGHAALEQTLAMLAKAR